MYTLINYDKSDIEVIAFLSDPNGEEISLEIGTDIYYETDDMSDDEIIDWATDNGYLGEEEEDYLKEDGTLDVAYLRSVLKGEEEDNLQAESTPSGRAYNFLNKNCTDCPADIKFELIDSFHPGDNSYGVIVNGIGSLLSLQQFLFAKGFKVNFNLRED